MVLDADEDFGERLARRCAALGWPVALHYTRLTPSVTTLIADIWDGGGVVRALPGSGPLEGRPPIPPGTGRRARARRSEGRILARLASPAGT